jgi:hypothetical protein
MVKTLEISDETYERIKAQLTEDEKVEISNFQDLINRSWFFRTVTYHLVGRVKKVMGSWVELEKASWIADSGRFMNFLKDGETNEVEPVGQVFVNLNTVVDFYPWKHELPKEQK